VVTLSLMQPIHIDELLGGTWHWEHDDDSAEDLEQIQAMLDELFSALVDA
jgi:hypothetical protein